MKSEITEIWTKYRTELVYYLEKKLNHKQDAEDIFQELIIKVMKHCEEEEIDNERAWLYAIARNLVSDHFRRKHLITTELTQIDLPAEEEDSNIEEATIYLSPLLKLLPEEYEIPLRMSELDGMKQADIARELNIGFSATRTRIHRAKIMLRDIIQRCTKIEVDSAGKLYSIDARLDCDTFEKNKLAHHEIKSECLN